MLFPMYTVSSEVLLRMTKVQPHEDLKALDMLIVFDGTQGKAGFVSHQWAASQHPDPDMKQMKVLQDALRHLLLDTGLVPLDVSTEAAVLSARAISLKAFQLEPLLLWYDYFSCPQLERSASAEGNDRGKAIQSIPAYIGKCHFFFGLVPFMEDSVLSPSSWGQRGWCRMERVVREISADHAWILVKSATSLEIVGASLSFPMAPVGTGVFGVEDDRDKLGPVLQSVVRSKLHHCLKTTDLPAYRRILNLQPFYFRGLTVECVEDLVPGFDPIPSLDQQAYIVAKFLHENGLRCVREVDRAGWTSLHYAALGGNAELLAALLQQGAEPNRRTAKDEPNLGVAIWTSALDPRFRFQHDPGQYATVRDDSLFLCRCFVLGFSTNPILFDGFLFTITYNGP
ncbi:Ankrd44 [Symbiodinium sp. CCMP2592]|nr:Ankrd44 [Symbiodinium sp. CCMP2592]